MLCSLAELSPRECRSLITGFGNATAAWKMGPQNWGHFIEVDSERIQKITQEAQSLGKFAVQTLDKISKENIRVFLSHQGPYPDRLRHIFHPPMILFVKGGDICLDIPSVAIVGSRRCTHYGEKVAARLAEELAQMGVVTISGLARGIDTHVHWACVNQNKPTWAVIGSGLSKIYPPENIRLSKDIEKHGAVISEFGLDTVPHPSNFPRRNRIIAGLSLGTVVVEGSEKSGALITARLAAEEGRDVFAVPGPITSTLSAAPHRLLRLGAKMVESATDIVEEFSVEDKKKIFPANFPSISEPGKTKREKNNILSFLGAEPVSKEELALKWGSEKESLARGLLEMELKGLVKSLPGGRIVKL